MKTLNLVDRAVRGGWGMAAVPLALALLLASHPAHAQRMPQDSWYLAKEMKPFIEPGKFYHPHDAALGPDGNLYVAHLDNHRGASRKHADAAPSIAYPLVAPTNRNPSHAICTA